MKRWAAVAAAALFGVVVALFVVPRLAAEPHEFTGTVLSFPEEAPQFTLTADTGEPMGIDAFRGKVVLLYFGYTFCPDICPASLAELADAIEVLGDDGDMVQVVMVSVDPARDTPEVLGTYVDHFDPSFVGMTGTDAEIADVAARYNIFYEAQEGSAATGYLVDHWSGVMVIDPDGKLVELLSFGTSGELIAADVGEWLS
ncbi:MAG: SCO family protein [Actinomycetota bacterium]|nr:SCO family protein [Actinomycetota bacterium]